MNALEFNVETGEPFLRLPAPFSNIILTPPRMSDVEPSIAILNDPNVGIWLGPTGPGSGYSAAKAEGWLTKLKADTDAIIEEVRSAPNGPFSGCPVRHVREVREDGTDIFVGDVSLVRAHWPEVLDTEEKTRLVSENNARAVGDPDIVWHVSYYLAPSHQGRGLTTVALNTVIQWGIRWMKAKHIQTSFFAGNQGSIRVLQKNGFVLVKTLVEHADLGEEKKRTVQLMERV